ncbi:MAG: hypothetical protein H0V88_00685 [Pyrinomonadaceae bacterium]|nr:hypothetical protein [Pyrinomonadaceae bacterium]
MFAHKSVNTKLVAFLLFACALTFVSIAHGQRRRAPGGGMRAVIVDERLAALRSEPSLTAPLVQRLSRGRNVSITGTRRASDGITFHRVAVTRRTRGWLQAESLVSPARVGDDEKLLRLIRGSEDVDRIARARISLDLFPRSPLRPAVLLIFGDAAEEAAVKLSRQADRRLNENEMRAGGAPEFSYALNYNGLDRYNRHGVTFTYDRATQSYHYDGGSWQEILRRYPRSPEAMEARKRLSLMSVSSAR